MSFKKTITFTAKVSDYTDGTVGARVQAENKILGDFITWLLAQDLSLALLEKVEIGDTMWTGQPFQVPSGSAGDLNHTSLCTDLYFLGRGRNKKALGVCIDGHVLRLGLTDTPSRDLDFAMTTGTGYARLPAAVLRASTEGSKRLNVGACGELATFDTQDDTLELTLAYWRGPSALVIIGSASPLVISREPYTCLFTAPNSTVGLHFSLDDDFLISDATYSFAANNTNYASNRDLDYGMSYSPFFARANNYGVFEQPYSASYVPTCLLCHRLVTLYGSFSTSGGQSYGTDVPLQGTAGMASRGAVPGTVYGFPRIGNAELYIRKIYVPMTRPAIASPVKFGYTPGQIQQGAVYSVKDKYYVALQTGIVSYFVEVTDQGE